MSDSFDSLEQELANLKPREPSRELRAAVDASRRGSDARRRLFVIRLIVAGMVTGSILLGWGYYEATKPRIIGVNIAPPARAVIGPDESQPTLQTYRRAIDRSPEELDALLTKQASSGGETTSYHAFSRSELNSLGER